jgi:DnaJ-class molecular chaperone
MVINAMYGETADDDPGPSCGGSTRIDPDQCEACGGYGAKRFQPPPIGTQEMPSVRICDKCRKEYYG